MTPHSHSRVYWIFRLFCPDLEGDYYVCDQYEGYRERAGWCGTSEFHRAWKFTSRGDCSRVKRAAWVKRFLEEHDTWFWGVVKITETVTTTYEVAFEDSDAPAMVAIARAAS